MHVVIGVCGIAMGHTARQLAVGTALRNRGHRVSVITTGLKQVQVFRDAGFDVFESWLPMLPERHGKLSLVEAVRGNWRRLIPGIGTWMHVYRQIRRIGPPDVVISDYEPTATFIAAIARRPLVAVDQQSKYRYLERVPIDGITPRAESERLRVITGNPTRNLVCSFVPLDNFDSRIMVIPPVLPEGLVAAGSQGDGSILAYFSRYFEHGPDQSLRELSKSLENGHTDCVVRAYVQAGDYEAARRHASALLEIRSFDRRHFLADLCRTSAVITNGGFNLISESIALGKPLWVLPLPTYDQRWCAKTVEAFGVGISTRSISADALQQFRDSLRSLAAASESLAERWVNASDAAELIALEVERIGIEKISR